MIKIPFFLYHQQKWLQNQDRLIDVPEAWVCKGWYFTWDVLLVCSSSYHFKVLRSDTTLSANSEHLLLGLNWPYVQRPRSLSLGQWIHFSLLWFCEKHEMEVVLFSLFCWWTNVAEHCEIAFSIKLQSLYPSEICSAKTYRPVVGKSDFSGSTMCPKMQ